MPDLMTSNCAEAFSWRNDLFEKKEYSNGNIEFKVLAIAKFQDTTIHETVKGVLTVNGYNGGFIDLMDGRKLKTGKAPMSFWSTQQTYSYSKKENVLKISGNHPKFGSYIVELHIG